MSEELIKLEDILSNPIRTVTVPGLGKVKYRDPTQRDKIEALNNAKNDPRWKDSDETERNALIWDFLAIQMLEEPKIKPEDYYKANSTVLSPIVNAVISDYAKRLTALLSPILKVKDFLGQTKEDNP